MGKLETLKAKLASLLIEVKCEVVKTDRAVLEIDGDLVVGAAVYVTPEGAEERIAAEDGEYVTEENKVITVAEGKVISIEDKKEEKTEETPAEEEKDEVVKLKERVDALEATVAELTSAIETLKNETLSKLSMSAAKPATEEFEQMNKKTTGDARIDKLMNGWK